MGFGPMFVMGCGSVGTALVLRARAVGVGVLGGHCRTRKSAALANGRTGIIVGSGDELDVESLRRAEIVVVAVPDPQISTVAQQLADALREAKGKVFFHCSGARNAEELCALRAIGGAVASFHPLLSFANPEAASELLGEATFAVEGDEQAVAEAEKLAELLGGRALAVRASDRELYHAAAAVASNHLVALAVQAVECLTPLGWDQEEALAALLPLMRSTLKNMQTRGLPHALTGPVSRGDAACVVGHLKALEERASDEIESYLTMAKRALRIARQQGIAGEAALDEVEAELTARDR